MLLPDLKHSTALTQLPGTRLVQQDSLGSQGLLIANPEQLLDAAQAQSQEPRKWHWLSPMELQASSLQKQLSIGDGNPLQAASLQAVSLPSTRIARQSSISLPFLNQHVLAPHLQPPSLLQQQQQLQPVTDPVAAAAAALRHRAHKQRYSTQPGALAAGQPQRVSAGRGNDEEVLATLAQQPQLLGQDNAALLLLQQATFSNAASAGPAYTIDSCMGLTGDQLQLYMAGPWASFSSLPGNSMFADADATQDIAGQQESIFGTCPPLLQPHQLSPFLPLARGVAHTVVPGVKLQPGAAVDNSVPQQPQLHHHRMIGNAGMAPVSIPLQVVTSLPLGLGPLQVAQHWQQDRTLTHGPAVALPLVADSIAQAAAIRQPVVQHAQQQAVDHSSILLQPVVPLGFSQSCDMLSMLPLPEQLLPAAGNAAGIAAQKDGLEAWMAALESTGGVAAEFGTGSVLLGLSPSLSCADMAADLMGVSADVPQGVLELASCKLNGLSTGEKVSLVEMQSQHADLEATYMITSQP